MKPLLRLLPQPTTEVDLVGHYLSHQLRQRAQRNGQPFFFSNFVVSLDGRIAVPTDPDAERLDVPPAIANDRDWRLFQELVAQSDLILISGRFLRDWAHGRGHEILQSDQPRFADLARWRAAQGLAPQPDIGVISGSLHIDVPDAVRHSDRRLFVFTGSDPDPARVAQAEGQGAEVVVAGGDRVVGASLVQHIAERGYQTIFSATGPRVVHLPLAAGALSRLYLTHANRVLAGATYQTAVEGALLQPPADFTLSSLLYDAHGVDGLGQLFAAYDHVSKTGTP